ncbi:MAG TPA: sodium:calcium antiporter, partial [Mariprofundaceae bacterium]|nr:sodium:calcium antiporter [Mariprofundaceae bacterium]
LFAGLKSGWQARLRPEHTGIRRDIAVFLSGFTLATLAGLLPEAWQAIRMLIAMVLVIGYFMYLLATIRASQKLVADGHGTESDQELYAARLLAASPLIAILQLAIGLVMLIGGARMFVGGAASLSELLGVSALVISLLIIPIATELPEKVNSVIWIRRRKDTLAFGNITGAMVFQGTIIPALGMLLMPWHFDSAHAYVSVMLALAGSAWLWFLTSRHRITPANLMVNAALYGVFIVYVLLA